MTHLSRGTSVTAWPRWLVALTPGRPPQALDPKWTAALLGLAGGQANDDVAGLTRAHPELFLPGEPTDAVDPWLNERLRRLDRQYAGWWLALHPEAASHLDEVETCHARPRLTTPATWPTLPASTLLRHHLIESLAPTRTLLLDDPDGLSLLLARDRHVAALPFDAGQRQWLAREARRAGVAANLRLLEKPGPLRGFDLAVLTASEPRATHAALELALAAVSPGGHLIVAVRYPWERALYTMLERWGLSVANVVRDVDHAVLPGGLLVDGGGDLLVIVRPAAITALPEPTAAEALREQPHALVEIESLAPDRLDSLAIDRFATAVEMMAPRFPGTRDSVSEKNRDVLWWYDVDGFGFSAELRRDKAHLSLAFAPLDPALLTASLCAALVSLGDDWTRTFALRTTHSQHGAVLT